MPTAGKIGFAGLALGLLLAGAQTVSALTKEAAKAQCRETVGHAIVRGCMAGNRGMLEQCRAKASPTVRQCVIDALNKANGRANIAVEAPKEQAPSAEIEKQAEALPTTFVAPPRTITDITDVARQRKTGSGEGASNGTRRLMRSLRPKPRAELAKFYYKRGNARAQSGRFGRKRSLTPKRRWKSRTVPATPICWAGSSNSWHCNIPQRAIRKRRSKIFQRKHATAMRAGGKGYQFGALAATFRDPDPDGRSGAGGGLSCSAISP